MKKFATILAGALLLTGCMSANYTPPTADNSQNRYTKVIPKSFDDVWKGLVRYSGTTFFAIENFEKDSGLMTLSFGSGNPSSYITGGNWEMNNPVKGIKFKGDYVDFIKTYANGKLNGKMNIVVIPVDDNATQIQVNARYIFDSVYFAGNRRVNNTWSFDSGSCGSVQINGKARGTDAVRTICPTYKAENAILSAIQ